MGPELLALLEAAGGVSMLVRRTGELIPKIQSRLFARNDELQQQLLAQTNQVQENLRKVGELAGVVEIYARTHEDVLRALWMCREVETFLGDNLDECRNRQNAKYETKWRLLERMFEDISRNADSARRVVMRRAEWYDVRDESQIELLLSQYTEAFNRASAIVQERGVDRLTPELSTMTSSLRDAETALKDTLYNTIIRALKGIA